jgi:Ala-tRNA(Pro) deacylase
VDAELARADRLVMRGGTHEDAIEVATAEWMRSEGATPVERLGRWAV